MFEDFKHLMTRPILIISLLAIATIPAIYTSIFLGSMWDPYSQTDNLKIHVVNHDEGATVGGEDINLGADITEALEDNDKFDWNMSDREAADTSLEQGEAYAVVVIPESASSDAATLLDETPKKVSIEIETNPGYNYLGSVMGGQAGTAIKDEIGQSITELYTENLLENLEDIKSSNTELIDALNEMQSGIDELITGSEDLQTGIEDIGTNVDSSSSDLAAGNQQVTNGLSQLNENLAGYESQVTPELAQPVASMQAGVDELISGNQSVQSGIEDLGTGVASGTGELAEGNASVTEGLNALDDSLTQMIEQVSEGNAQLEELSLTEENASSIADPVEVVESEVTHIDNYGQTFAPFIISVSLFLGSVAFSVLYPINRAALNYKSHMHMTISKLLLILAQTLITSLLLIAVLIFGFNLKIENLGMFLLILVLWNLGAMMFITVMVALLGNVGKFIAIIFLILQISSSASTFPIQTTGPLYQYLHPLLPMSYVVTALREAVFDFEAALATSDALIYLVVVIGAGLVLFTVINALKWKFTKFENITRTMSRVEY
ncbi:YhgE/Pip family protein [Salinicoccus hispanicus]|uniref:ABC transporter permease n=1 Tax=Salinicoccus hispanicus TaxID=157225 RepID=A0A6N8TZW0_9STAP|nr:YhgE/Pip family protein [Salinicoccus hispanicus]MXQ51083.1 ABC transporter permease [Salinicoccus hispanicus]